MNKRFFNQQNLTRRLRLLSVLYAMLLLPLGAWAENYPITVAGIQVTDENAANVLDDETATVSFTPASGDNPATLTLNNATITGQITSSIDALTVHLVGKNTITPGDGNAAFFYSGTGTGTLTFDTEWVSDEYGMYFLGSLIINGVTKTQGSVTSGYTISNTFEDDFPSYIDPDNADNKTTGWKKTYDDDYTKIWKFEVFDLWIGTGRVISSALEAQQSGGPRFDPVHNTLPINGSCSYPIESKMAELVITVCGEYSISPSYDTPVISYTGSETNAKLTFVLDENTSLASLILAKTEGGNHKAIEGFTSGNITITNPLRLVSPASKDDILNATSVTISNYTQTYDITVAGVQVTDENATDITGTGITTGTVSFTPAGDTTPATLTLEGANLTEGITTSIDGLVIDLIGDNTITSSTQAPIKGTGDTEPTLTLKSSGTTVGSLKLILTEASNYNITQDATLSLENPLVRCDDGNNVYFEEGYQLIVGGIQMSKHQDIAGKIGGISANNAYNHETNTLTLDGWLNDNASIVSGLPELKIKLMGSSSFSNIMANDDVAGTKNLIFQTENSNSKLALAEAISGFNYVTYQNNLVLRTIIGVDTGDSYSVETISKPTMTGDGNNVTFNFNAGLELHYSIDYAKEGVTDVTDVTIATSGTSVALSGPCTVTAYTKWNNSQSDNVVGKLFGFASNTVETTYSEEVTLPTIIPTLPEGITLFYNVHEGGNTAGVTSDDETGTITGYSNVGEATVNVELRYEESPDFIILNEMDGDFETLGDFTLTVVPKSLTNDMIQAIADQTYAGTALTPAIVVKDGETTLTQAENAEAEGDFTVAFSNNTNAALSTAETAPTVTITGKGNYTGTATKTFTIAAKDLASATVTVDPNQTYTYTGSAITPNVSSVSIKLTEGADAATNLTAGTDYTVTGYANNTDAALATAETNAPTVTITGKGNFTGTATGTFTIAQAKLSAVTIAAIGNQTFTGSQITPGVTVTFNEKTVSTDEYNVVYGDNINAGENAGTVTLTSKNKNFVTSTDEDATTKKTATFNIVAATAAITATDQTVTFDGEEQPFTNYTIANGTPRVTYYSSEEARTAQSGGTTSAPTEAAIYYVQVTQGDANYTSNPANATFTISPMTLTSEMVILSETNFEYTGGVRKPEVTVKLDNTTLTSNDYTIGYQVVVDGEATAIENPIDVGDYNVVVTGKGNYTGTVTKQFSIGKTPATVTAPVATNPTYTGSAQNLVTAGATESGTVVYSLSADGEFTETIPQATDAGSYTVYYKATGDDNHSESAVGNVAATIAQANLGDVTIAEIGNQTYTGSQIKPEVTVTFGGKAVSEEEYTIGYGTNTNVGEGTVTLTSKNKNFSTTSTKGATFTIVAKTLTADMVISVASATYTGSAVEPELTIRDGDLDLVGGSDYTVVYSDNVSAGTNTAKATITGKGNYTGSIDKMFTINKAQLTVTPDDKTYNVGETITLTLSYDGFVNGEDETALTTKPTASCETADVTKPGSYEITASGGVAQNYDFDYKTGTLTINRVLDVNFSASNKWATYYGSENLATPEGLKAYQVTAVNGSTVTISEIGYIPANTAVLLENTDLNTPTKSNIPASASEETTTFPNNILKASASAVDVSSITGGTVYILIKNMFRRATGTIPARRGYLVVAPSSGNAPELSISIGDETTIIGRVGCDSVATDNDEWFTLDGQKLQQAPTRKGLYIKNGKKVVINKK